MATLETIAASIKQIASKKEDLKKAYDELQSHSSLLSSFCLSWSDLDAHFTQIEDSLTQRFRLLESLESTQSQPAPQPQLGVPSVSPSSPALEKDMEEDPEEDPEEDTETDPERDPSSSSPVPEPAQPEISVHTVKDPSSSNPLSVDRVESVVTTHYDAQLYEPSSSNPPIQDRVDLVLTQPELRTLCENMDGKGLRKYINERRNVREKVRVELPSAIRASPDPGWMVLDAMEGFYGVGDKLKSEDPELWGIRRACLLLLEVFSGINVNISKEVRDRAKNVALDWRKKLNLNGENGLALLGFLHLVAAYGLGSEFEKNFLVDLCVPAAKYRQGVLLCKAIDLGESVQDLIQKLMDSGKQILAVKYIFEFKLTEKYPPVPLLKAYLRESQRLAKQLREDVGNSLRSQNEATAKEVGALKAIIKVIEDHKLESEYPIDILLNRVGVLEKLKADRKRPAPATAPKPQQQPKKLHRKPKKPQKGGNKRPRTTGSIGRRAPSVVAASRSVPLFPQSRLPPAGLLPENSSPYMSTPAGPYGLVGSTPVVATYTGSPTRSCGMTGAQVGFLGNSDHAATHLYSTESQMPSGYYDGSTAFSGYGLPSQYHPSYHP